MTRYPRLMPTHPRLFTALVTSSVRMSPSFQRVTIAGDELASFEWNGFDHWFRIFLPPAVGAPLRLPVVSGRSWWKPYLAIPERERPHCSNYTVADIRAGSGVAEMDVDVVLHWDASGDIAAGVAGWAVSAEPGSPVGLLDQGPLFDPPDDMRGVHLVADESGLPAVRGILRDLGEHVTGTAIIEVPHADDIEPLAAPAGVDVVWIARGAGDGSVPGTSALAALRSRVTPHPHDYAFVVGESTLATEGRRALHRAGLPKSRITFSGFWKHTPHCA
ncbi:siderophore-interacting protein [Herbiconiux daphne]|uniref:Siderophore-interacting protein n=1 Tax=Herbiconiux daphne TaxID=2970914 RepID=A0ABT2H5C8_9MICO|nr:siderophore-interacting protein [Herbiconiux daphne]MCS5735144.1 siderophore-interacting protein [Herbiconiux daphne]